MFKYEATMNSDAGTEQRLLNAAGEIFAEYGYRAATIRQICEKAGANIAAVNYHFGDKDGLYKAVLRFVNQADIKKHPHNLGLNAGASAEQRLRAYIQYLLSRIFEEGRPSWHMKLMAREMTEPTRAFETLVEEAARPLHQELSSIIRDLLGPEASDVTVHLCTLSVLGQSVYYHRARPVISRLYPRQRYGPKEIEALVDHITQFSLLALEGMTKKIKSNHND